MLVHKHVYSMFCLSVIQFIDKFLSIFLARKYNKTLILVVISI